MSIGGNTNYPSRIPTLQFEEFVGYLRRAASLHLDLTKVASPSFQTLLRTQARSLNCSEDTVFFLLLSCCAGCMGRGASLQLTSTWQEPPIFWSLVITSVTYGSLGIMDRICEQLLEVQNECAKSNEERLKNGNQFIIDFFDEEGLLDILERQGHAVALYNNLDVLNGIVTVSQFGQDILEKIYNGSPLSINCQDRRHTIQRGRLNIACICEPLRSYQVLCKRNNFRVFLENCFVFVGRHDKNHRPLTEQVIIPPSCSIKKLFRTIVELHRDATVTYKFSSEAHQTFSQYHDELIQLMRNGTNKNSLPVFMNAIKLLARICLILHVIENALHVITWNLAIDPLIWNVEISANTLTQARLILNFLLEQSTILLQSPKLQPVVIPCTTTVSHNSPANAFTHTTSPTTAPSSPSNQMVRNKRNYVTNAQPNFVANAQPNKTPATAAAPSPSFRNANETTVDQHSRTVSTISPVNNSEVPGMPTIVSVSSAGLPVNDRNGDLVAAPNLNVPVSLPSSLSISVVDKSTNSSSETPVVNNVPAQPSSSQSSGSVSLNSFLTPSQERFFTRYKQCIYELLMRKENVIPSALLNTLGCSINPSGNKRVKISPELCRYILQGISDLGLGHFSMTNGNNLSVSLKKKSLSEMRTKQLWLLQRLDISETVYKKNFESRSRSDTDSNVVVIE